MTETYFAGSELPLIMSKNSAGSWIVGCKWKDARGKSYGVTCTYNGHPDRDERKLVHKQFLYDYELWKQHQQWQEPPRIR